MQTQYNVSSYIIQLYFNYDVILTKEPLVLTKKKKKKKSSCEEKNMQTQYNVSSYIIELYFHDNQLTIETDENGRGGRNIDYQIKKTKSSRTRN